MAEMSLSELEIGEPELTYWKPAPTPMQTAPTTYAIRNPPIRCGPSFPPQFHPLLHTSVPQHTIQTPGFYYPVTNVQSSVQNQNIQMLTDNLIHEEVTKAAKTLFSKRNRTLLHWLNPDVSKSQLKVDVNMAWERLPAAEKVFYISQVLGKFAPHSTTLMINSQLETSKKERKQMCTTTIKTEKCEVDEKNNDSSYPVDIMKADQIVPEPKGKKSRARGKYQKKSRKRRVEYSSDDEGSCDSGLVVDIGSPIEPKKMTLVPVDVPKVKRKYTTRKEREKIKEGKRERESIINYCSLPDTNTDLTTKPADDLGAPRVKRKYTKRKLVRRKYKKREPKNKVMNEALPQTSPCLPVLEPELLQDDCEEMDIWIELENDSILSKGIEEFNLLNEEVDNFWNSIDNPNSLFLELDIN